MLPLAPLRESAPWMPGPPRVPGWQGGVVAEYGDEDWDEDWDEDDFDDEFDDDFDKELDEELEHELAEKFADDGFSDDNEDGGLASEDLDGVDSELENDDEEEE